MVQRVKISIKLEKGCIEIKISDLCNNSANTFRVLNETSLDLFVSRQIYKLITFCKQASEQ